MKLLANQGASSLKVVEGLRSVVMFVVCETCNLLTVKLIMVVICSSSKSGGWPGIVYDKQNSTASGTASCSATASAHVTAGTPLSATASADGTCHESQQPCMRLVLVRLQVLHSAW